MSKHTPGPWTVNEAALTVDADGRPVADVRCSEIADEAIDANARLIAACPSMIDMLNKIRHAFYVDGTAKALRPVMEEAVKLIRSIEE